MTYQILGDEGLNEYAMAAILGHIPEGHQILFCSGFDFESKVIAISEGGVVVGNDEEKVEFARRYPNIARVSNQGRTLVIRTDDGIDHRYRMGNEQVVRYLVSNIRHQKQQSQNSREAEPVRATARRANSEAAENVTRSVGQPDAEANVSIGERVKFWEEQDKINQELIPRVIRQNELLTTHIADHENLPLIAGNAIGEALAEAREEQQRHYDTALEAARQEMQQQYDAALEAAKQESQQQYDAALEVAKQEQQQLHDTALEAAKTAITDEAHTNLDRAVATLNQEWRKTRNILIGITAASGAIAVAAIVVVILT